MIKDDYSFSRVTMSPFENGYIIALINEYIYLFDYKGSFIFKTGGKLSYFAWGHYYSLVPIKYYNGYFYYTICYTDEGFYFFDIINFI